MLVPHHLNPPVSGKGYTSYLGYWLPLALKEENKTFLGLSRKIFPIRPKTTPFAPVAPSCIRVGGGGGKYTLFPLVVHVCSRINLL